MDEDQDFREFDGRCRLFPLPGVVLFPHAVLPLHIFEPRYRQMTEDALGSDRLIAMVQVRSTLDSTLSGIPELESVACIGKILTHERLDDGRFNLLLHGRKRVRIVRELKVPTLYRQAEVEILEDIEGDPTDFTRSSDLITIYRHVASRAEGLDPDLNAMLDNAPPLGVVTDILSAALGLPPALKQSLLDDRRADRRADRLISILQQVSGHLDEISRPARRFPPQFSDN